MISTTHEGEINALLLEDYMADAELIEYHVKYNIPNCNITHVSNKQQFREYLKTGNPDIILSDFNIPNFSALEAYEQVKTAHFNIPFIVISGEMSEEDAQALVAEGIDDYLFKSSLSRVGLAVKKALKHSEYEKKILKIQENITTQADLISNIYKYSGIAICEYEMNLDLMKKLELALQQQDDRDTLISFSKDLRLLHVNECLIDLIGAESKSQFKKFALNVFDDKNLFKLLEIFCNARINATTLGDNLVMITNNRQKKFVKLNIIKRSVNGKLNVLLSFIDETTQRESEMRTYKLLQRMDHTISERTKQLREAHDKLQEKTSETNRLNKTLLQNYKQTTDSIRVAKKIQRLLLPNLDAIRQSFSDAFVYYRPKDIVSGDFYWHHQDGDISWIAVGDCTGHGVPGALTAMTGCHLLNEIVKTNADNMPHKVLQLLDDHIITQLKQRDYGDVISTGMDMSLCKYDRRTNLFYFTGAFHDLYRRTPNGIEVIRGNRRGIGGTHDYRTVSFDSIQLDVNSGDQFYFTSDGFLDQFGEETGKKFMKKRFIHLLENLHKEHMDDELTEVRKAYGQWKGKEEQIDDVVVIGIKI